MSDYNALLPPSATAVERSLLNVLGPAVDLGNDIRALWNPATIPAPFLPWLAFPMSVDEWDDAWSDDQKRAVIAASAEVHRRKGTIGAVRRAVQALGYSGIEIIEGVAARHHDATLIRNGAEIYGHRSGWALFRVRVDLGNDKGWMAADAVAMRRVIEAAKNTRSWLYSVGIKATLTDARTDPANAVWRGRAGLALRERRSGIRDGTHRRAARFEHRHDGTATYGQAVPRTGPWWSGLQFGQPKGRAQLTLRFGLTDARQPLVPRDGTIQFNGWHCRGEAVAYARLGAG